MRTPTPSWISVACLLLCGPMITHAENIDPDEDASQYAYSENLGWVNAEPGGNGAWGITVGDSTLTGWAWAENAGWVSLSCAGTSSCGTVSYGVTNDGDGNLAGYAWGENVGWISFSCTSTGTCGTVSYGVVIDPLTGDFSGRAWSENAGWITFASSGPSPYKIKTSWRCTAPTGGPTLMLSKSPSDATLTWTASPSALYYDVVRGDLGTLASTGGDFSSATQECIANDDTSRSVGFGGDPAPGEGYWFLVRAANCGPGSYDAGGSQTGSRDAGIAASGYDCP